MKPTFDILGLGCTAVDDLLYVADYPPADAKARVLRRERHCGGLTATALVAAARVGARCAYAGVLGSDEHSRFVLERLQHEGIDINHVVHRNGAGPVQSAIVVDQTHQTRNIFFDVNRPIGAHPKSPSKELICSAKVLFVDIYGMKGMIRAARIARAAGIPIVGDFERNDVPQFDTLFSLVDHLIVPDNFACKFTGEAEPAGAAKKLWNKRRQVVIVTCGAQGCQFVHEADRSPQHFPAFKVPVLDTTGCGDVFHGAYAAALARGMDLPQRIRFASATAALKATMPGGQAGIPTLRAVQRFLKQHAA